MMEVTYEIIGMREAKDRGLPFADFEWTRNDDLFWWFGVWRCENGVPVECVGYDGGEPEDQVLIRDWKWVPLALKAAYDLGRGQ
jgi:hypothetical protein